MSVHIHGRPPGTGFDSASEQNQKRAVVQVPIPYPQVSETCRTIGGTS